MRADTRSTCSGTRLSPIGGARRGPESRASTDVRQVIVGKDSEGYRCVEDTFEWYYSQTRDLMSRQHDGEVETFATNHDGGYHVTKPSTIPRDTKAALVTSGQAHGTHEIEKLLEVPIDIWREVTNQPQIER